MQKGVVKNPSWSFFKFLKATYVFVAFLTNEPSKDGNDDEFGSQIGLVAEYARADAGERLNIPAS